MMLFRCRGVAAAALAAALVPGGASAAEPAGQQAAAAAAPSPYALSDAALYAALAADAPGAVAEAKRAAASGDLDAAKKRLADYYRARTGVPWPTPPRVEDRGTVSWDPRKAEAALSGTVTVVTYPHTFPGGDVDWFYNLTVARPDLPDNNEWQWQLNRMGWWGDLARAYQATGDEKYAALWVKQLRKWAAQCPPPAKVRNATNSAWRTIECGIRMSGVWPAAFSAFLLSPTVTDDDIITYLKVSVAHARYLKANATTGNWLTMEMSGLYNVGALFPEFAEAKAWRDFAADKLYAEAKGQFLPDGAQIELSPGYHNVALDNCLKIYSIAQQVGRVSELPPGYLSELERALAFNLLLMTPDRNLPRFNDSWPGDMVRRMQSASALFPRRDDFRWVATGGKEGKPPAATSHPFDWAGFFVMRSGWGPDANYAVLDAGPLGYGHVHQDKLNLVVWAYGREVLFDSGGGSYESSKWRSFGVDTFGHNTVLVDGKPQRRQTRDRAANVAKAPIDAGWESGPKHDFAQGVYADGYGAEDARIATHSRRVLYAKPDLFLVSDLLTPADGAAHTYQARWHLDSTRTAVDPATKSATTGDAGKPNLAVVPLLAEGLEVRAAGPQEEPEVLGWHVRKDEDPQRRPATSVLHTRSGAGPQRFLTLLIPLNVGETNPVTSVTATGPASAEVMLTDGRTLVVSDDPAGGLRVAEKEADGGTGRVAVGGAAKSAGKGN
ncbi:MAG TPA: alginate lyase family protein [Armatimonadaceae bacterium]|nr:alginate lyase family protein [Armatimonadaceae bacterium]